MPLGVLGFPGYGCSCHSEGGNWGFGVLLGGWGLLGGIYCGCFFCRGCGDCVIFALLCVVGYF